MAADDPRARIVDVAARLLREQGAAAVTTRGVAEAAGVQAPAIYRFFGDKDGLLVAVAEHVLATWVAAKAATVRAAQAGDVDPLEDLRRGWEHQIAFGLDNPAVFRLLTDPARVLQSPSLRAGRDVLVARVHRVAEAGLLRVAEPRVVGLLQAAATGVVQTLLATPPAERDAGLADAAWDAVAGHVLLDAPALAGHGPASAAVALRAVADRLDALTPGEQRLLAEWLDRVAAGPA